jgi:lysozyme family protein
MEEKAEEVGVVQTDTPAHTPQESATTTTTTTTTTTDTTTDTTTPLSKHSEMVVLNKRKVCWAKRDAFFACLDKNG